MLYMCVYISFLSSAALDLRGVYIYTYYLMCVSFILSVEVVPPSGSPANLGGSRKAGAPDMDPKQWDPSYKKPKLPYPRPG